MATKPSLLGARIKRREDPRLIQGLATYTDDLKLPRMLAAAFVRSQYAAGKIRRIDATRAKARPGVVAVYTFDDVRGEVGPTPCIIGLPEGRRIKHPILADGVVRYVGQPIVVVVAEDRYLARDAALDVEVDIEPGPVVVDPEAALAPDAPRVYPELPDNLCSTMAVQNPKVDQLFAAADGVVKLRLVNQRVAAIPMEPRAVLASWDEGQQRLTVWTSNQMPHGAKQQLAICLGIPELRIRVIAPEVGGAFGAKIPTYPEECLLPWISRRLRRPIKWAETRTENLLNTAHGRGHVEYVEAAYRESGEVTAVKLKSIAEIGAYPSMVGPAVPSFTPLMVPGCYRVQAISFEVLNVYTNTMATDAYRGAGRPEAAYIIERVMDAVGAALGLDPTEVRRRNFIPPEAFPYTTATGAVYDSANYAATLDRALELFDYAKARREQEAARKAGRLVGIGVAMITEICGFGPSTHADPVERRGYWESAEIRIEPTGNAVVMTGTSPHGQGQETAFAQMVADALGIDLDDVIVLHGDTDVVTHGVGTFGSRGLIVGGTAVRMALDKVIAKGRRIAAHLLEVHERDVEFADGTFAAVGGGPKIGFRKVALAAHLWNRPVPGEEPGLEAVARFEPSATTFPFGAHLAQVEIDRETGELRILRYLAVDDVGNVINPLLVDGQRLGGIVQGAGQALLEEIRYDEAGQLVTGTLADYAVPRAPAFPRIELDRTCTTTTVNPLGAKGVGELGTIASPPCLVSAAIDALRPLGVTHLDMPLKPERLWAAIQGAQGGRS
ncbi:MAG TPA: xanthine dehydrogenase family protein molybdopterin-binding subunit [Candidatus Binatia bacterium]|nr:xanthine dehydrogenase family protein molybdopterin-binding subunit [Candidatus Binatia bacterium]